MKTNNLLTLLMIAMLTFAACEPEPPSDETSNADASVTLTVKDAVGAPVAGAKITMYAQKFPESFIEQTFYSNNDFKDAAVLSSDQTDNNGMITFVIDGKNLSSHYPRHFYFQYQNTKKPVETYLKNGDKQTLEYTTDQIVAETNLTYNDLTVVANNDGSITVKCSLLTNVALDKFGIFDREGNIIDNYLSNQSISDISGTLSSWATKDVAIDAESNQIPIGDYEIVATTQDGQQIKCSLGEFIDYEIGSSKSKNGSYLSIINNRRMTMYEAKSNMAEVIAVSSVDGYTVIGLQKATNAISADVAANAGKVAFFHNGESVKTANEGDIIVTESGCICKISSIQNESTGDATIQMYTIRSYGATKTDVSNLNFY